MGGDIGVTDTSTRGTTFGFNIIGEKTKTQTANGAASINLAGKTILVVDDNPTHLQALRNQLSQWNAIVTMALSAREAEGVLANNKFGVVIVDLKMPHTDGQLFGKSVRSQYPGVPVILMIPIGESRTNIQEEVFDGILAKPVKQQALSLQVKQALDRSVAINHNASARKNLRQTLPRSIH